MWRVFPSHCERIWKQPAYDEKYKKIIAQIMTLKETLWKEFILVTEVVVKLNVTCSPLTSHSFKSNKQELYD